MVVLEPHEGELPEALLQFKGANFPAAGKVMLARDHGTAPYQNWKIRYDGDERNIVKIYLETSGKARGELSVSLRMPRSRAASRMQLDLEASKAFDVDAFIATHLRHKADGTLDALAKVDRKYHKEQWLRRMAFAHKEVEKNCGQALPYEVDFASISDVQLSSKELCEVALRSVAKLCRRDTQTREDLRQRVSKVRCAYAENNNLSLDADGTLNLELDNSNAMNSKEAYTRLKEILGLGRLVLEDEKKRIIVFDPDDQTGNSPILLGDDKVLRKLRLAQQALWTWDPHARSRVAELKRADTGWQVRCRSKTVRFHPVSRKRRASILKNAKQKEDVLWRREAFALARDNRGIYYYVDRLAPQFGGKSFRVFRGPRGQVGETALVDIVDDSDGKIFATKRGKLRLVIGKNSMQEALWIEGKKRHKLVVLPLSGNIELIYTGLGIYDSEVMGTICE